MMKIDIGILLQHSMKLGANNKRRMWKNLKQILAAEKTLQWKPADVTCESALYTLKWF